MAWQVHRFKWTTPSLRGPTVSRDRVWRLIAQQPPHLACPGVRASLTHGADYRAPLYMYCLGVGRGQPASVTTSTGLPRSLELQVSSSSLLSLQVLEGP